MFNYSIIIPHYNIPALLERCVNSIPVRDDVQIIVVDDCSPCKEDLNRVIENLRKDREIEFYTTPQGGSAGRARNIGLDHARGKWLIFADADDFFDDDFESILDENISNNNDVLYLKCRSVQSDDISKPSGRIIDDEKHFDKFRYEDNARYYRLEHQVPWGIIIKRSLVIDNRIRFDETRYANDAMFAVSVGCFAQHIDLINRNFYVVTERENALCSNFFQKPGEALIRAKVALRVRKRIQEFGYPVDDEYKMFLKILLWQNDFKGIREIYQDADSYGISKEEILSVVNSNGLRYRPVYYWLKYLS